MRKTFKYRLLGGKTTFANAERWLDLCRNLYNAALEERITAYKMHGISLSCYDQIRELTKLKVALPEYNEIDTQVQQDVLERLDWAYKGFFARLKRNRKAGLPRFKSRNRYSSFTLKHNSWKLDNKYLSISKVGKFKLRLSRPIEGVVKTITIRRNLDKWYVFFSCDKVPETKLPTNDREVGIDVGIKSFLVDSDNNVVKNPTYHKVALTELRRKQRVLSRRKKGSNGRHMARVLVAKAYEKIKNQRNDFLHKQANYYVQNYNMISVETLNISGLVANRCISKSVTDAGWGIFIKMLEYKAEEAGRRVVRIPQFEPTSKTCSKCGTIKQDLTLNDRQWVCQSCGTLHDRDYNAAKNILRVGQTLQAQTCGNSQSVACESPDRGLPIDTRNASNDFRKTTRRE